MSMLTKSDLKQIGVIVRDQIDVVIEGQLEPIKNDLKYLKKKVNRIDKSVNIIVKNYDEGDIKLDRRVRKIEQRLGISE